MKLMKKVLNIALIFAILQIMGMIFLNFNYSDGYFQNVFKEGATWDNMKENKSNDIIKGAEALNSTAVSIYNSLRLFGAALIIFFITCTVIGLNARSQPLRKAETKIALGIILAIAIIFLFLKQIVGWFQGLFNTVEDTMAEEAKEAIRIFKFNF